MLQTTLCYLEKDDAYLMLHRVSKKDDVNAGKWIGVGGKFEKNEAPEECMIRETLEETGLRLNSMRFRGMITFVYSAKEPEYIFTYTSDDFSGELSSCNEGVLRWIPKKDIFGLELWEGDRYMLEYLVKDRALPFSLKLCYDAEDRLIEAYELSEGVRRLK